MPGLLGFGMQVGFDDQLRDLCGPQYGGLSPLDELSLPLLGHETERKLIEHCGVFGAIGGDALRITCRGLGFLSHRGQDGSGVAYRTRAGTTELFRGLGRVDQALSSLNLGEESTVAIGHNRYGTTGGQGIENVQPFTLEIPGIGQVAIAHNGNLTNADHLRARLQSQRCHFKSTSDTEVVLHLMAEAAAGEAGSIGKVDLLSAALRQVTGSYSIIAFFPDGLLAARDPHGNRPLSIGKFGDATIVTSESCGWDSYSVYKFDDVPRGAVVEIALDGSVSEPRLTLGNSLSAQCLMELLYFSRPDSTVFGVQVQKFREEMGKRLYQIDHLEADIVVPLMASGADYAVGYSAASGIPLKFAVSKNPNASRVFILSDEGSRHTGTLDKHCIIRSTIAGKRVVLIDDSVVRGTTLSELVRLLRADAALRRAGAKEVHVRIAAPPIVGPCHYGISTPDPNELAANKWGGYRGTGTVDPVGIAAELCRAFEATSFAFGTLADQEAALNAALGGVRPDDFCNACFTGKYDKIPGPLYHLA
jgi:amidophosphoribosyltransferase